MTNQPAAQTWKARWCSPGKHLTRPWNTYLQYRKTFDLAGDVLSAGVRVSADARYTLYVNGQRIHQGPARSHPEHQSFDRLDLKPHLRSGKNVIAAIVHQFGVPTFFAQYRDATGLLLDGVIETTSGSIPLHTPDGWMARPAKAWRKDVARLSLQMGFQEHFDADADEGGWLLDSFDPKPENDWKAPGHTQVVGGHPWLYMEERGVPLLADRLREFGSIHSQWSGESARGYKVTDDIYHFALQEKRKKEKNLIDNPQAMLRDNDDLTIIPAPADGEFTAVVLEAAPYFTGHLVLDIADAKGDEIIDCIYSERLDDKGFPHLYGPGQGCEYAVADRYRCRPGSQRWEAFQYKAVRYLLVIFRNLEHPLKVRHIGIRQIHGNVPFVGAFESSDAMLNRIWETGRQTQINCLFDSFVDCPAREQAQWWGDARVQAAVTAHAFGDSSLLARGIRQVAQSQSSDGSLHACPPNDNHLRLPDFMMTWVGTLWDLYWQTGRTDHISEYLPVLKRLFQFFHSHEGKEGFIGDLDGWWVFLDWVNLPKNNYSSVLNMMYLQALRWATSLCKLVGDTQSTGEYDARAVALQLQIEELLWDAKDKRWADGWDPITNTRSEQSSQHMHTLAILLDLKPDTHNRLAHDYLLKSARSKRTKVITASSFFYAYVLQALIKVGLRSEAIDIIRAKWADMIDAGAVTFWENWDGTASNCHAWSSSPLYHIDQQVLGVIATEPGWSKVRITPLPLKLEFARGVVPTPHGPIKVDWERVGDDQLAVRVDLPPGIEAEFVTPGGQTRTLNPGANEFHT